MQQELIYIVVEAIECHDPLNVTSRKTDSAALMVSECTNRYERDEDDRD
jgi:hypothetical protein